jgi:hypothetical protein
MAGAHLASRGARSFETAFRKKDDVKRAFGGVYEVAVTAHM